MIPSIAIQWSAADGDRVEAGRVLGRVNGPLASVLTAERTALNFLGHLSGVATLTRRFVDAAGSTTRIRDTRKTTPGLRALEKAAVRAGGGVNHRASLSDGILLKDNHLAGISIEAAIAEAKRRWPGLACEVECDTLDQVKLAVAAGADLVLVDNMDPASVGAAVQLVGRPRPRRGVRRRHARQGRQLRGGGRRPHLSRRSDPLCTGARHRPWTWSAEPVLLAIDVGNTQTVIGPVRARRRARRQQQRVAAPLADRHRRRPGRRTRWRC